MHVRVRLLRYAAPDYTSLLGSQLHAFVYVDVRVRFTDGCFSRGGGQVSAETPKTLPAAKRVCASPIRTSIVEKNVKQGECLWFYDAFIDTISIV